MKKEMILIAALIVMFSLLFSIDKQFIENAKNYDKQINEQKAAINSIK